MKKKFLKNKRVLITGGAGLLGISLTKLFLSQEAKVFCSYFNRRPPKKLSKYFKKYDFNNLNDCIKATKNMDYVIISAVQASGVKGVLNSPTETILPNLKIHSGLFEACAKNNVKKVVWISSSSVYQKSMRPISENKLNLNLPTYEMYLGIGWVYRYLEKLAQFYYLKRNLKIGIIRTANIYGPFDRFDDYKSHVIPGLIKRASKRQRSFIVWGSKNTVRDFVFVDDLSIAVLNVLEKYCKADPINFSSGKGITIYQLVREILNIFKHKPKIIFDAKKPTAVPYRVLNNKKYNKLFKKFKKTEINDGLQKTIQWFQSREYRE